MQAIGLKTHIWNNNAKCVLLLGAFPFLIMGLVFALMMLWSGYVEGIGVQEGISLSMSRIPTVAPIAFGGAAAWFGIAFFAHNSMINLATKAKPVTRSQEPEAYDLLENLCISRGMTMPRLNVIETDVMNAFASGIRDKNYAITLTRGLLNGLNKGELEAVIAHELSHILHRDVRLLVITVVFVGIISFVGEIVVRGVMRTNIPRTDNHRRSGGGNSGALIFFALAIIAISYMLAIVLRFALSRKREYMADAGSVELTKNPDAMISALQKISGKAEMKWAPAEVREMALENPKTGLAGLFATHPPIEKRIAALVKYAGGRTGLST